MEAWKGFVTKSVRNVTRNESYQFGDYTKGAAKKISDLVYKIEDKEEEKHEDIEDEWFVVDEEENWQKEKQLSNLGELDPDVIFVGAGPVGIWTAIQLKLRDPSIKIKMYEKYEQYQRSHVLRIDKASLRFDIPHGSTKVDRFKNLVQGLPLIVRTNELEEKFLSFAKEIGIHIELMNIQSIDQILNNHLIPPKVIIGSDGSHSLIRKQIFNDKMTIYDTLQHIVDIKYDVIGEARKLKLVNEAYPTIKLMNHVAEEFVGKYNNNKTPVTLRLLISPQEYQTVKNASFKNPFYIPTHSHIIHSKILESINIWMNAKIRFASEERVPGSEKLSALNLSVYLSDGIAKQVGNCTYFLVGDAAFGVPFFRALNNGLLCGTQLSRLLAPVVCDKANLSKAADEYDAFVKNLGLAEIMTAARKKNVINIAQLATKLNGASPIQVVRFSGDTNKFLKTNDPNFRYPTLLKQ